MMLSVEVMMRRVEGVVEKDARSNSD
jgi:hypothetical protein